MEDHGLATACRQPRVPGGPLELFPDGRFSAAAAAKRGAWVPLVLAASRHALAKAMKWVLTAARAAKPSGYTTELLVFASDCDVNTVQQGLYAFYICRVRDAANIEEILACLPPPPNGQSKSDYYGDFLVITYGVSDDWGRQFHEHRFNYKEFIENRKEISMAWLFPAPVLGGFEQSDEPPRHPNRPRILVEKQIRNVAMRADWQFDYIDAAGNLRIELVAVAPEQLEIMLDAYETVGYKPHNAAANNGQLVESLAEELVSVR